MNSMVIWQVYCRPTLIAELQFKSEYIMIFIMEYMSLNLCFNIEDIFRGVFMCLIAVVIFAIKHGPCQVVGIYGH